MGEVVPTVLKTDAGTDVSWATVVGLAACQVEESVEGVPLPLATLMMTVGDHRVVGFQIDDARALRPRVAGVHRDSSTHHRSDGICRIASLPAPAG